MNPPRATVAVAGAGITGLVAALDLAESGHDVVLIESSPHLGGKLTTRSFRGRPLDLGPDAFIARNPAASELCQRIGLGDELITPSTGTAAIFARGAARPFPRGLVLGVPTDLPALARSGIVTLPAVARAALDLLLPGPRFDKLTERARSGQADPTIAEVVAPRLGWEVFAKLVDPLLGGINAGDARALSFVAAAPTLAARLGSDASLIRSLRPAGGAPGPVSRAAAGTTDGSAPAVSPFRGLERGVASLIERLEQRCLAAGVEIHRATAVERVRRDPGSHAYVLDIAGAPSLRAEGVVLALPSAITASLLAHLEPRLARECSAIPYAGVALVTAAFAAGDVAHHLVGSGVLVPRSPGAAVTALTFVSQKWPRSSCADEVVVRASLGRHGDDGVLELDDDTLAKVALEELAAILGVVATPLEVLVQRWPASFPQYLTGHLARVARIEELTAALPGLELAGASYRGIGIPACVEDGRRAAARLTAALPAG